MSPVLTAPDLANVAVGFAVARALGLDPTNTTDLQLHTLPAGDAVATWCAPWVTPAGTIQWGRERRHITAPQLEALRAAQYLREFAARHAHGHPGDSIYGIEATRLESTAIILEGLARS